MSENSTKFIGNIPENYDRGLGPVLFEDYASDIVRRATDLDAAHVVELAAGTGIVSRKLRDGLSPNSRLTVTDLNPPMLEVAKAKFNDDEYVEFSQVDAMSQPFEDNSIDLVLCQFGVMFFPDKAAGFREIRRVLTPGGHFLFNAWGSMNSCPYSQIIYDIGAELFPDKPPNFYRVPFSYGDIDEALGHLKEGGFEDIRHETINLNKEVQDWQAFCKGAVFGNPLIDEINQHGTFSPEEVMNKIFAALEIEFGGAPTTMPLQATVYHALK